jgi:hypothetical protein
VLMEIRPGQFFAIDTQKFRIDPSQRGGGDSVD